MPTKSPRRQSASDGTKQAFALAAREQDVGRRVPRGGGELAREEGTTDFEGDGHGGGVGFAEEVIGQVVEGVVLPGIALP